MLPVKGKVENTKLDQNQRTTDRHKAHLHSACTQQWMRCI